MDVSAATGLGDARQKTRAKSCTACRQAKAKCDLRARYPSPCGRCEKLHQSCQTDASFQRVASRSRLKALEAQVEQLNRSRVLEVSLTQRENTPTFQQRTEASCPIEPGLEQPHSGPSIEDGALSEDWYLPAKLQFPSNFALHDCTLPHDDVVELFMHFAAFYLPHCRFLVGVESLEQLEESSKLLLWTIILIAARYHEKHHFHFDAIQLAHTRLYGNLCGQAIQSLLDLQAMMLLCMWPLPVERESVDSSFMHLGEVISCARQMGLDRDKDEVFFGTRRSTHQLSRYPARVLKLTWLKCFELDVDLSLWHGTLPTLAASRYFKSVADFCRDHSIPREAANSMDIYVRTSRYLLLLDETQSSEASWTLAKSFLQGLAFAKKGKGETWSLTNELDADTCQMYICMTGYVHVSQQQPQHDDLLDPAEAYAKELLLEAKDRAIRVIIRVCALSDKPLSDKHNFQTDASPLPGYPKHVSRTMFFAAAVLLRYIDGLSDEAAIAREKARNAFQKACHFFYKSSQSASHIRAGQTLELAGRAIDQRHAHLQSRITTRMGASVRHDVNWLSGLLRNRDKDKEYAVDECSWNGPLSDGGSNVADQSPHGVDGCMVDGQAQAWTEGYYSGTETLPASMDIPFQTWDAALDDVWSNWLFDQDIGG